MISNVRALERVKLLRTPSDRPDRAEVEAAIRTLIEWTGDDPDRDGLAETPSRVARAFEEFFAGYGQDPEEMLRKTFEEIDGYDEMVVRGIRFESHCEHHMAPIIGQAWVAYVPNGRVVGITQAGPCGRGLCQASANSGKDDGSDRKYNQRRAQAPGRRSDHQGVTSLHDHPWSE